MKRPGTGSTDVFGSIAFLYLIDKESALFASGGYRHTGGNDYGGYQKERVVVNVGLTWVSAR